ncbi:MAG TPA: MarR family transcriptional regulator [Azospirillum sp.]|nr:MarR family transcriptional regulator [Azospirillum sp.]
MTDDNQTLFASIGIQLQDTARAWRLKLDQRLRPLGLSQAKWRALVLVDRAGDGVTQKELAELLGVEGPTLVRLLDRLEADGWVERRMCAHDRRSRRIHLSQNARAMLAKIEAVAANLRRELLSGMPGDDLAALHRMLRDIRRRVDETP